MNQLAFFKFQTQEIITVFVSVIPSFHTAGKDPFLTRLQCKWETKYSVLVQMLKCTLKFI